MTRRRDCMRSSLEVMWLCLPALVAGLVLRLMLSCQMPYGYIQVDTPEFLTTSLKFVTEHRFELDPKKTFLAPLFFTAPFALKLPALKAIPIAQHTLGMGLILMVGVLCRLWFIRWKWFIVPL